MESKSIFIDSAENGFVVNVIEPDVENGSKTTKYIFSKIKDVLDLAANLLDPKTSLDYNVVLKRKKRPK